MVTGADGQGGRRPAGCGPSSGGGPPQRGSGRDGAGAPVHPGRRAPVERTDQSCPVIRGQRAPAKTDRTSGGLFATAPTVRNVGSRTFVRGTGLTTRADLTCFDFRCFPIVGLPHVAVLAAAKEWIDAEMV